MPEGERFNAASHLLGLLFAVGASVVLFERTQASGDAGRQFGAAVFALSLLVLYAASTLFHASRGAARVFWQRADHCAIYLLIAGTFTPFATAALQGGWRWAVLAPVWLFAAFGIRRELRPDADAAPPLGLYLAMGWFGVLAAVPLVMHLSAGGLAWLLLGAAFYSAGTVFYRNPRSWPHAHGVWHLFVLAGSASHFVAIGWFVL